MQVQAINLATPKVLNNGVKSSHVSKHSLLRSSKLDSFEKQTSQISFTGLRKSKKSSQKNPKEISTPKIEKDIDKSMKDVPLAGMSFLLGLATSAAMVKLGDGAKDLLLSESGYLVSENGVKTDLIDIDRAKGIIEFTGTGISIDSSECDIADWDNGIFRNHDGSIDIDLANNKFIDTVNGIFVDPAAKISAILDGNRLQNMAIPSFGSGYPTCPWDDRWLNMPKSENVEEGSKFGVLGEWLRKIFKKDAMPETNDMKDIFGNDMVVAKDKDGDTYLAPYMKSVVENPIFKDFTKGMSKEDTIEAANDLKLKHYIDEKYPNFSTRVIPFEGASMQSSGGGPHFDQYEWPNKKILDETLEKRRADSSYIPEQGSEEAKSFALHQEQMIKLRAWKEAKIDPNLLLGKNTDLDGDTISDFDRTGDGRINFSSKGKPDGMSKLKFLLGIIDKNSDGNISKEEVSEFIKSMDENGDGKISIGEVISFLGSLFKGQ